MHTRTGRFQPTIISLATAYDDQSPAPAELVVPESFDGMEYSAIQEGLNTASAEFETLYAAANGSMTPDQAARLGALTDAIEAFAAELAQRDQAQAQLNDDAAALAARVQSATALSANTNEDGEGDGADGADGEGEPREGEDGEGEGEGDDGESAAQTITASAAPRRTETRIPLSGVQRQAVTPTTPQAPARRTMRDVAFAAADAPGVVAGEGIDFLGIGRAIDRRLASFNEQSYKMAANQGRAMREQHGMVTFAREFPEDLTITSSDREHVDTVISRAVDESRLVGANGATGLVASGGWCAPSETLYDLLELESRDGMLSLPEVGIARGGISFTTGPSFADIYGQITGFAFTEADDIEGKYQPSAGGNVEGPKPCYHIECPDFQEVRLDVNGLCLTAGLLQQRGYPEVIARTVRGALIAHEHRINKLMIDKIVAGSTAVNMGNQVGAAAPILDSIEKQAEHVRYTHRLARGTTLEAFFPFWVRGAIRSDLSRRLGVDLIDVSDARIDEWFRSRGINAQFVYNWQAIDTTTAANFKAWPTTVSFAMYPAGTWVRGSSDIITLDTIYDSTLLSQNDYTALFTEEGWLVAKRGFDSRVITVGIEASGGTHMGVDIAHDGTLVTAG